MKFPKIDLGSVGQVLSILQPLSEIVGSIGSAVKAAKQDGSPGGRKVTIDEISVIVADHLEAIATLIVGLFLRDTV
jgi:hypothetical protein